MLASFYVKIQGRKFGGKWTAGSISVTKKRPYTDPDEIAVQVHIELPDSVFEVPQFVAKIEVPESAGRPETIESVTENDIADVLSEQLGIKVHVDVAQPEGE